MPNPSFEKDIKPMFRPKDRNAMLKHFDLWLYQDVRENVDDICSVVSSGKMPCDGPWAPDQVSKFKEWMDSGMAP
jgi:hypothetical protein